MNHRHAAVEIADQALDSTGGALKTFRVIAGSEAFRKYDWIRNVRGLNSAGNFRGMVVSSRWGTAFHFAEESLKVVEKVAVFAALAANIYKARDEIHGILNSNADWATKSSQLSTQVSSVCLRTVFGVVPAGAHVIAKSIGGYLQLADLAGLHQASRWNKALQSLDASGQATFDRVTDGNNIYLFVNKYLVIR